MKEYKYYCDLCETEHPEWDFIHVEIKASVGYEADCSKSRGVGGKEDLNICNKCAEGLGYVAGKGSVAWCNGVRKMFLKIRDKARNRA
ncbi:MAG: hypothetical protein PF448_06415 [Bacteroidales bacterium]|jgi:hypothetical protein|nr:hypothetical protein [Bacteroidales bacterium]